ncbi:putative NSFL1 cofactor p47 [Apostichopus japonicus]|uniref:Putative NSFL1 cofactor p47 n=1 Tax=Stichopus japonicus TaxID=307972 RepID=A0A2G8JTE6_STIJA|nr:putative NSFL1 cofactor p47 [Apostichopus japonicus]
MELVQMGQGGEVNLDLQDHRDEDYQTPKQQRKAFEGKGYKLGNIAPTLASDQHQEANSPSTHGTPTEARASSGSTSSSSSSWEVDSSQPITTLQLRLANGSRLTGKFNHTHTVGDIRRFIAISRPEYAATPYKLMTTFPNKVLDDESQTIGEANLMNAVIVQRST